MVKPVYASVAESAVTASGSSNHFAVGTKTAGFEAVKQVGEVQLRVFLEVARIREPDNDAEEDGETEESITDVEKPLVLLADSQNLVGGDPQKSKRYRHEDEVACERQWRPLLLLEGGSDVKTVSKHTPLLSEQFSDFNGDRIVVKTILLVGQRYIVNWSKCLEI